MSIGDLVEIINKTMGLGSAMLLSSRPRKIPVISTGVPQVDKALGVGGLPKGRIVEIYGPEASGKTTLALHVMAEAQKSGCNVAFIDVEHALDPEYAKALGVDINTILLSQPDDGESALQIAEIAVRSGECEVIVVDSVAALVPRAELAGDIGDAHIGLQARLMGQALRKLTSAVSKNKCILIFVNQIRYKIGVKFGSPHTTPGGRALKFFASVRIEVVRTGSETQGDVKVSNTTKISIVKNKVAPPFKVTEAILVFGKGFCPIHNFFPAALAIGLITKKKNTYSLNGERLAAGKKKAIENLQQWDQDKLYKLLKDKMNPPNKKEKLENKIIQYKEYIESLEKDSKDYKIYKKKLSKLKKRLEKLKDE